MYTVACSSVFWFQWQAINPIYDNGMDIYPVSINAVIGLPGQVFPVSHTYIKLFMFII